jgi:hypothetical protein
MSVLLVFLGGEGRNELGSWAGDPAYQSDDEPGVIKALLLRTRPDGWKILGAQGWKHIRKYTDHGRLPEDTQSFIRGSHEERAVLGLVLDAKERGAQVVAFVRDQDDDPNRSAIIANAIDRARAQFPNIQVVGGTAVPVLEAWILALMGETGSEALGKAKAERLLADRNVTTTEKMVSEVLASRPVPEDATHLCSWLAQAKEALA